jgi:hypothetical protein
LAERLPPVLTALLYVGLRRPTGVPPKPARAGFFISIVSSLIPQLAYIKLTYNPIVNIKTETFGMYNERIFRSLEESIEALNQIIGAQRTYIRAVEHERDLFAEGYWAVVKKCERLELDAHDQAKDSQLKQED